LEETSADPKFWEDPENSQKLLQQIKQLQIKVAAFDRLQTKYDDAVTMAELGIEAQDESVVQESEILT
jgi:peptide chain release factor 2